MSGLRDDIVPATDGPNRRSPADRPFAAPMPAAQGPDRRRADL